MTDAVNVQLDAVRAAILNAGHRLGLGARALRDLSGAACEELLLSEYEDVDARRLRDVAVLRDFTGENRDEVCRKHGVSRATFYRIVHRR